MNIYKIEYKIGDIIELIHLDDPFTELKAGDCGKIISIDYHEEFNQIWIAWHNGSRLALLSDIDKFKVIT